MAQGEAEGAQLDARQVEEEGGSDGVTAEAREGIAPKPVPVRTDREAGEEGG
jgi:hypothetical protein